MGKKKSGCVWGGVGDVQLLLPPVVGGESSSDGEATALDQRELGGGGGVVGAGPGDGGGGRDGDGDGVGRLESTGSRGGDGGGGGGREVCDGGIVGDGVGARDGAIGSAGDGDISSIAPFSSCCSLLLCNACACSQMPLAGVVGCVCGGGGGAVLDGSLECRGDHLFEFRLLLEDELRSVRVRVFVQWSIAIGKKELTTLLSGETFIS